MSFQKQVREVDQMKSLKRAWPSFAMGCINLLLHTNQSLQGKRKQAWEQCETMLCLQFNCLFRKEAKLNNRAVHLLLQQKILLSSTCPTSCFQIPMSRSVLDFHWEGGFSSAFPPTNVFFIVLRGMGVGRKDFVGGFRLPCAPWLRAWLWGGSWLTYGTIHMQDGKGKAKNQDDKASNTKNQDDKA